MLVWEVKGISCSVVTFNYACYHTYPPSSDSETLWDCSQKTSAPHRMGSAASVQPRGGQTAMFTSALTFLPSPTDMRVRCQNTKSWQDSLITCPYRAECQEPGLSRKRALRLRWRVKLSNVQPSTMPEQSNTLDLPHPGRLQLAEGCHNSAGTHRSVL